MQGMQSAHRTSQTQPFTSWNLTKGLNTHLTPHEIGEKDAQAVSNMVGFEGILRRRDGFVSYLSALPAGYAVHHLGRYLSLSGTTYRMALGRNTTTNALKAFYWDGAVWQDITGAAALTLTTGQPAFSCVFKGTWYFTTGGNDNLQKWVGVGNNIAEVVNADPALPPYPKPRIVFSWGGRLWTADSEDGAGNRVPYRLAWSDFLLDNVWRGSIPNGGSSGYADLADDSDSITGLIDQVDSLVVLKPDICYLGVYADYPRWFDFPRLMRGAGCVAGPTLARYAETVMFLGDDNVYALSGRHVQSLAPAVRPRLRQIVETANLSRAFALMDRDNVLYWLFLPKKGSTNLVTLLIFSFRDQSWWEGEVTLAATPTLNPLCAFTYRTGPWGFERLVGSADGKVYKMSDTGQDDATVFPVSWEGRTWDAMDLVPYGGKKWSSRAETMGLQRVAVHGASGRVKVQIRTGSSLDSLELVDLGIMDLDGRSPRFLSVQQVDRFVSLVLSLPDPASPVLIQGVTMHLMERGDVR